MAEEDLIKPVSTDETAGSNTAGDMDPASLRLLHGEAPYIQARRERHGLDPNTPNLVGLSLSGGGIRSATFSLGVMQAMASADVLKRVDYLSTVSGGGYMGSSLTWLTSELAAKDKPAECETDFGFEHHNFPYGCEDPRPLEDDESLVHGTDQKIRHRQVNRDQRGMLRYLRDHGYYLTPGAGISAMSLLGAVVRGSFLNLLVWIPIFVSIMVLILFAGERYGGDMSLPVLSGWIDDLAGESYCRADADDYSEICDLLDDGYIQAPGSSEYLERTAVSDAVAPVQENIAQLAGFAVAFYLSILLIAAMLLTLVVYAFLTQMSRQESERSRDIWYALRRGVSRGATRGIPVAMVLLLVGVLPLIALLAQTWFVASGPVAFVAGVLLSMKGFLVSGDKEPSALAVIAPQIGAVLFLYGVITISYQLAFMLYNSHSYFPQQTDWLIPFSWVVLLIAFLTGWLTNTNYISIHRYYRDRLMETFMPDINAALANETGMAMGANGAFMRDFGEVHDAVGPYHIVNTNVVLVNSEDAKYRSRGGDNFILSPLYCGSNATGWCETDEYMGGSMTLPTAVAISGAAANPNTGVGGIGLTRNLFVSLSMSLLNLRLGYWAVNPSVAGGIGGSLATPNHFVPGMYSFGNALGFESLGFSEHRRFLQLSDGGHFENTGLYELIRRRVKLAIVCDGGADPEFSFSDLQTMVQRVDVDFGAVLNILDSESPDQMLPKTPENPEYPEGAGFAKQGFMLIKVSYADSQVGWIIYMKTTLIEDVSFKVKGYKAQHSDFPDQSTADQFFDEVQFQAYRELGYAIAEEMLKHKVPEEMRTGLAFEFDSDDESAAPVLADYISAL
jgi:Patatin-like phospholipase